jgi:O-antigen/teichoic acid export membrane protein
MYPETSLSLENTFYRFLPPPLKRLWNRIRKSSMGYRLAHGAFWSMTGAGASQAMMLLTSIAVARILGKQQFGEFGIINNTIGMFTVFAGFGLGMTATKYVAEFRVRDPERTGRIIALSSLVAMGTGGLFATVLLLIAPWLAAKMLSAPQLAGLLRLSAAFLFFSALGGAQTGALAGFEAFRIIARINAVTGALSLPMLVGGVYYFGLSGAVIGLVITTAVNCIMNTLALRNEMRRAGIPLGYAGCGSEKQVLIGFSMPAVLAGVLVNPVNWLCAAILVNQPSGYGEMGIYSAANSWQKAILFLPGCLNAIALPMLSDYFGAEKLGQYRKALWYNIIINGGTALAAASVITLASPYIMRSYGHGFVEGKSVLIVLSFATVLMAVNSVAGSAIASTGRAWLGFMFNMFWGVALISLAHFLIPLYGAMGLALAVLMSYILHSCWQILYVRGLCRVISQ